MKIYAIKIKDELLWVKAVLIDNKITAIMSENLIDRAWYPEDKAKFYLEELNKTYKEIDSKIRFELEEVKDE